MAHDITVVAFELKWAKSVDEKAVNFTDIIDLLREDCELSSKQRKELADILEALKLDSVAFRGHKYKKIRDNKNLSEYTKLSSRWNEHEYRSVSRALYIYHEIFKWILNESEKRFEGKTKVRNKNTYVKPFVADIFRRYIQQNKAIFKERNCKRLDCLELTDDVRKRYDKMLKLGTLSKVKEDMELDCSGILKALDGIHSGDSIDWHSVSTFFFIKYTVFADDSYDQNEIDAIVKRETLKLSEEKRNSLK